jgi:hypothetical protein
MLSEDEALALALAHFKEIVDFVHTELVHTDKSQTLLSLGFYGWECVYRLVFAMPTKQLQTTSMIEKMQDLEDIVYRLQNMMRHDTRPGSLHRLANYTSGEPVEGEPLVGQVLTWDMAAPIGYVQTFLFRHDLVRVIAEHVMNPHKTPDPGPGPEKPFETPIFGAWLNAEKLVSHPPSPAITTPPYGTATGAVPFVGGMDGMVFFRKGASTDTDADNEREEEVS